MDFDAKNAGAEDVSRLELDTRRIDVVISAEPDGEQRRETLLSSNGKALALAFDPSGEARASATLAVPAGFIHQVRFVTDAVRVGLPAGSATAMVPSGPQTGIKVGPADGAPFRVVSGQTTRALVQLDAASQLVRPPGQGLLFKPTLTAILTQPPRRSEIVPGQAVVRFHDGVQRAEVDRTLTAFDARAGVLSDLGQNLFVVSFPTDRDIFEAVASFIASEKVKYARPRVYLTLADHNPRPAGGTPDPALGQQRYLAQISAEQAWARQQGLRTVVVAVLDTGVDIDHGELALNTYINQAEIPPAMRAALVDVEPDGLITLFDLNHPLNAGKVEDLDDNGVITGSEVRVAFKDGIDQDAVPGDPDNIADDIVGVTMWSFPEDGTYQVLADARDDDGHGTAVAGVVGALPYNGEGVAGLNWQVQILPIRVAQRIGPAEELVLDTTVLFERALRYARRRGAHVAIIPASLYPLETRGGAHKLGLLKAQIDLAYTDGLAGSRDEMLVVLAAGNTQAECGGVGVGCLSEVFSRSTTLYVASVDEFDKLSSFSAFGRQSIDIAAPGENIPVLTPGSGSTAVASGTSFAAAQVAGALALMRAERPGLEALEYRDRLLSSGDLVEGLQEQVRSGRRLNLLNAVLAAER